MNDERGPASDGTADRVAAEQTVGVMSSGGATPTGVEEALAAEVEDGQAAAPAATTLRPPKFRDRGERNAPRAAPAGADGTSAPSSRRIRGLFAAVAAVIIILVIMAQALLGSPKTPPPAAPTGTTINAPTLPAGALAPQAGAPLTAVPIVPAGGGGHLNDPHEAIIGPGHVIYVADPGAHAVLVYSMQGRYLRSITAGSEPLKAPFSLAVGTNDHLYVLDSVLAHILEYVGPHNTFVRAIGSGSALALGRGLAVGPNSHLYVVNPASNSMTEFTAEGTLVKAVNPPLGAALSQFNQPSAVSVGPDNSIFLLDNANQRIEKFNATLKGQAQWPAPASDTYHSVHVVALGPARLLVTDAHATVLDYDLSTSPATIHSHLVGGTKAPILLGVTRLNAGHVLVTDAGNLAVWEVTVPAAGT